MKPHRRNGLIGAEYAGNIAAERFEAVLATAKARGEAVLARFEGGRFVRWEMVKWPA
jgi:hypothetical protein